MNPVDAVVVPAAAGAKRLGSMKATSQRSFSENLLERAHTEASLKLQPSLLDELVKAVLPQSQPAAKAAAKLQQRFRERQGRVWAAEQAAAVKAAEAAAAARAEAEKAAAILVAKKVLSEKAAAEKQAAQRAAAARALKLAEEWQALKAEAEVKEVVERCALDAMAAVVEAAAKAERAADHVVQKLAVEQAAAVDKAIKATGTLGVAATPPQAELMQNGAEAHPIEVLVQPSLRQATVLGWLVLVLFMVCAALLLDDLPFLLDKYYSANNQAFVDVTPPSQPEPPLQKCLVRNVVSQLQHLKVSWRRAPALE